MRLRVARAQAAGGSTACRLLHRAAMCAVVRSALPVTSSSNQFTCGYGYPGTRGTHWQPG
eukprot:2313073-Rhodomonas_salina.1